MMFRLITNKLFAFFKKELAWECFYEHRNKDWFVAIENRLNESL